MANQIVSRVHTLTGESFAEIVDSAITQHTQETCREKRLQKHPHRYLAGETGYIYKSFIVKEGKKRLVGGGGGCGYYFMRGKKTRNIIKSYQDNAHRTIERPRG